MNLTREADLDFNPFGWNRIYDFHGTSTNIVYLHDRPPMNVVAMLKSLNWTQGVGDIVQIDFNYGTNQGRTIHRLQYGGKSFSFKIVNGTLHWHGIRRKIRTSPWCVVCGDEKKPAEKAWCCDSCLSHQKHGNLHWLDDRGYLIGFICPTGCTFHPEETHGKEEVRSETEDPRTTDLYPA